MGLNYAALRDGPVLSALNLLGASVTLRKRVQGSYDPETQSAPITTTDYATKGVIYDGRAMVREGDNMVSKADRRMVLSASGLSVEPVLGDEIVFDGETFAVAEVRQKIGPAGTVIAWELALGH